MFRIKLPFATDLYNASVCALKAGKPEKALHYCLGLAEKGIGEEFFINKAIYRPLRHLKGWSTMLHTARTAKTKLRTEQGALLDYINSLVEKDQRVNRNWRQSGMTAETRTLMDLTYDTIATALNHIFDSLGFLSEDKIGALVEDDTVLSSSLPFDVIIIHNFQSRMTGDSLFSAVLRSALQQELIKPEYYAKIHDFSDGINGEYYGTSHLYIQYHCTLYKESGPHLDFRKLDADRNKIGLPPLSDHEKKVLYLLSHPDTDILIRAPASKYINFKDKASEDRFLSTQEVLVKEIPNCIPQ